MYHVNKEERGLKGVVLQDPFLNTLRKERIPVAVYLVNGIKLQGIVESFDQFVILLKNNISQMVYKHAISTIVPSRSVHTKGHGFVDTEEAMGHHSALSAGTKGDNRLSSLSHPLEENEDF